MLTLLNFMTQFSTVSELEENKKEYLISEQFNFAVVTNLQDNFERMKFNLPIKPVPGKDLEQGYTFGKHDQRIFIDEEKKTKLKLKEGSQIFDVLGVGLGRTMTPSITILEENMALCFSLPEQLTEWVFQCIGLASMNQNPFPSKVLLTKQGDKYYVDFII